MNVKQIGAVVTIVATMLAGAVAYAQLDLPLPASNIQVAELQDYAISTRQIVLNQQWQGLFLQISAIEAKRSLSAAEVQLLARLRAQLRLVEQQLQEISR